MQARLKVLHDKANVKHVKLLPVTLIGRSTDCNLKIASSQVSRNHCRITLGVDAVFVEDLGSANGTLVDGQPIPAHQPTAIAPGSHLVVGPAEFQIDYVASTSATLVLPRNGVPRVPDLSSTEMIFPKPAPQPALEPAAVVSPVAAPQPQVLSPPPEISSATASPPVAVPVVDVAGQNGEADSAGTAEDLTATVSADPSDNSVADSPQTPIEMSSEAPVAEDGGFEMPSFGEETESAGSFVFNETVAEPAPPTRPVETPKKGGLKSLFSLFGRKEKPSGAVTDPVEPAAVNENPVEPGVFLPTIDVSPDENAAESAEQFSPVEIAGDIPADAVESVEQSETNPESSSEEDDGFKQFLSQF